MDENIINKLEQALKALKALQRSTERALNTHQTTGTGKMVVRSYEGIQKRIQELLPDDFYVETIVLDLEEDASEETIVSQVNFAANQLYTYLRDMLRGERGGSSQGWDWGNWTAEAEQLKSLGRDIQDQVMGLTRNTIRRALTNIDIDIEDGRDFRRMRIEGENWSGRNLSGADFRKAILINMSMDGMNLNNVDLRKARVEGCNLNGANLGGADMRKVIINQSRAKGINLDRADLNSAIIYDVNLKGANLGNANLRNAKFIRVDLRGANLSRVDISGMIFHDVTIDESTTMPDGRPYEGDYSLQQYGIRTSNVPVPPLPPIPPAPPEMMEKPKRKHKVRISVDDDEIEHEIDQVMDELDEEMDSIDAEMDQLDAELDAGLEGTESQNRANAALEAARSQMDAKREQMEAKRARLEERRRQIEAEMRRLEDELNDE